MSEKDPYRAIAARMFQVQPAEVSDEQRRAAKSAVFGHLHGMSGRGVFEYLLEQKEKPNDR